MISLRDVVTGFKVRDPLAEVWRRDLRGGGSAEITGTLPLRYIGYGKPLTDYMIYGNTVQNGTPTPEAPVDVAGCGVWDETHQSYKLPLTCGGTEYPIYLGTVPTTRRVKKLVLTGEENISKIGVNAPYAYIARNALQGSSKDRTSFICSHIPAVYYYQGENPSMVIGDNLFDLYLNIGKELIELQPSGNTVAGLKEYLAAQYANGTPVTVWYVLAEPETGIVNEPLMKIGVYADTISFTQAGVAIPTVSGANVLDMTSPVKPSEVYIKGKGIKPTGYGQLVDNNDVRILDKNNVRILVHGQ